MSTEKFRPVTAITMGDPAGIGPEVVVKALASDTVKSCADCLIVGDKGVIDKAIAITLSVLI